MEIARITTTELASLRACALSLPRWEESVLGRRQGEALTAKRGRGLEYEESRQYQPGDDIRHMDSRVSARRGELFTKVYREERQRRVYVFCDNRATMHFATRGRFKRAVAARAAVLIAWRALLNGDEVGGLGFGDPDARFHQPSRSAKSMAAIFEPLIAPARREETGEEELSASLDSLLPFYREVSRGSLVFVFSDFRGMTTRFIDATKALTRGAVVVAVRVLDTLDQQLPIEAATYVTANRSGSLRSDSGFDGVRKAYAARAAARDAAFLDLADAIGGLAATMGTRDDPLPGLAAFLSTGSS